MLGEPSAEFAGKARSYGGVSQFGLAMSGGCGGGGGSGSG